MLNKNEGGLSEKQDSEVLAEAIKVRDSCQKEVNYGCHTQSKYSDGYGDTKYGDYGDAD